MGVFTAEERRFAEAIAGLARGNPFLPERVESERAALGREFSEVGSVWSAARADLDAPELHPERPNIARLRDLTWAAAERARERLSKRTSDVRRDDLELYEELALYALFARYEVELYALSADESKSTAKFSAYPRFRRDFEHLFVEPGVLLPSALSAAHTISVFFQIRRAFHWIFRYLLGPSLATASLRAETWRSVFTHDLRAYQRGVYRKMGDVPTLVVGPSGTGKDLVAQAIGYSRYIAFDEERSRFVEAFAKQFHPLSIAALPASLVESELFGHRRGSFTGALEDRVGFLEVSGPEGTVFLDEIGELLPELQVKLLRVLQARAFQRVGETSARLFLGKIVAATNCDLDRGLVEGWFREDLYYRLCADRIETPTLRARLDECPEELALLVGTLAERIAGLEVGPRLAEDVLACIERDLGGRYEWPGNVRELEQCVRNVLVRKSYRPPRRVAAPAELDRALLASGLTTEALVRRYSKLHYEKLGNYVEVGRRLGLDRRTVKEHVEAAD
jgi:transcriptional regulator with AAA-type ATPase domain